MTYSDILSRFIGPSEFSQLIGVEIEAAKQIFKRQSIPARYGAAIVRAGRATAEEILAAAAQRHRHPSHERERAA